MQAAWAWEVAGGPDMGMGPTMVRGPATKQVRVTGVVHRPVMDKGGGRLRSNLELEMVLAQGTVVVPEMKGDMAMGLDQGTSAVAAMKGDMVMALVQGTVVVLASAVAREWVWVIPVVGVMATQALMAAAGKQ